MVIEWLPYDLGAQHYEGMAHISRLGNRGFGTSSNSSEGFLDTLLLNPSPVKLSAAMGILVML